MMTNLYRVGKILGLVSSNAIFLLDLGQNQIQYFLVEIFLYISFIVMMLVHRDCVVDKENIFDCFVCL